MMPLGRDGHLDRHRFGQRSRVHGLPRRWRRLGHLHRTVFDPTGRHAPPGVRLSRHGREPRAERAGFRERGDLDAVLPLPLGIGGRNRGAIPNRLERRGQRLRDRGIRTTGGRRTVRLPRDLDVRDAGSDRRSARDSGQGTRSRGAVDRSEPVHPSPCGDRRPVQFPVHPRRSPPYWNDRRLRLPCIANPPSSEREISLIARPEAGSPANVRDEIRLLRFHSRYVQDDFAQAFYRVGRYRRDTRPTEGGGRMNPMRRPILGGLLPSLVLFTASAPPTRTTPVPTVLRRSAAPGAYFDYVLVLLMENHNLCAI